MTRNKPIAQLLAEALAPRAGVPDWTAALDDGLVALAVLYTVRGGSPSCAGAWPGARMAWPMYCVGGHNTPDGVRKGDAVWKTLRGLWPTTVAASEDLTGYVRL